jgi:nucleoside-diphosphate-sugar epimerase
VHILVTGNLGYIGVAVTAALRVGGHRVVGLDTDYYANGVFGSGLPRDARPDRQLRKDIRDVEPADLAEIDAIVHLAALSNDPTGELDPALTDEINCRASVRLARLARATGVSRFVFASSCSIYGQASAAALTETAPFHPQTAYARSKVEAEAAITQLADDTFSPVYLRNATAYGLSSKPRFDLVVNNLTGWAITTGQVKLLSDGRAWRPIVHVQDIAQACRLVLEAPRAAIHNQAFNVGSDTENYQVREIAERVAAGVPGAAVTFGAGGGADSRTYNISFGKIRRHLPDFRPAWTLELGIWQLHTTLLAVGLTVEDFLGRRYTRLKQLQYLLETKQLDPGLRWQLNGGPA